MRLTWLLWGSLFAGCVVAQADKDDVITSDPVDSPTGDTGVAQVDADKDGFPASIDCNDADPEINPDAVEACDGIDNDCSTVVDDGDGDASIQTSEGATLYATVDEAITEALESPGTIVDICPGTYTLPSLSLEDGDELALNGAAGRTETTLSAETGATFAALTGDAALEIQGVTVTGSFQRAFVLADEASLTLIDSVVSNNPGGGVLIAEGAEGVELTIQGSSLIGNVVSDRGGAILAEGRAFDIVIEASKQNPSRLAANRATRGGAIALVNRPGAQLPNRRVELRSDTGFDGNIAAESGGAIYTEVGTFEIDQVTFDGNTATETGGAIDLAISSVVTATGTTLLNNQATIGGAISMDEFGLSLLSATGTVSIIDNVASEAGGGISGAGFVSGVTLARNEAPLGGGVHVPSGTFLTLEQVDFDANVAIQGAGMFLEPGTDVDLLDATFTLNEAVPEFFAPQTTTTLPPVPLPLPDVVEADYAGLGGVAFLVDGAELQATTSDFGIDDSEVGGVDNDNRPGDIFIRALGSDANHEQLGLDASVVCDDLGCLLVQNP